MYDLIKLQRYKTVACMTCTATTMKLKCASHYVLKSFLKTISVIENFESAQTINHKRNYKLQQLFKMLSLSLDTGLESYSPLSMALSVMVCSKSTQTLTSHCVSSPGCVLVFCTCASACCHGNNAGGNQPCQAFQTQLICN